MNYFTQGRIESACCF